MIKHLLRTCSAAGCRASGILSLAEHRNRRNLAILCFHRILPKQEKAAYFLPDLVVTPSALREYCRILSRYFEVLPLFEAMNVWQQGKDHSRPLVVLTFDDGYRDNYDYAADILEEFGLRATFFVIAGLVNTRQPPWYDLLGRTISNYQGRKKLIALVNEHPAGNILKQCLSSSVTRIDIRNAIAMAKLLPPNVRRSLIEQLVAEIYDEIPSIENDLIMTSQQLHKLTQAGQEIGSHSLTHDILTQLNPVQLHKEIHESRDMLQKFIGREIQSFCYPNGNVDETIRQHVQTVGYRYAVTTQHGNNRAGSDSFMLKRYFVHENRLSGLRGSASGTLMRMEISRLADLVFARRLREDSFSIPKLAP